MNYERISIELEVQLENELYKLLQGEIVESILKEAILIVMSVHADVI